VVGTNDLIPADVAALNNQLRADQPSRGQFGRGNRSGSGLTPPNDGTVRRQINGAYFQNGSLFIPNRGPAVILRNGDVIAWDTTTGGTPGCGWPIFVSADAIIAGGTDIITGNAVTSKWILT
jgi:hypothetical protein